MEGFGGLSNSINGLKQAFRNGETRAVDWRKSQLQAVLRFLAENEDRIFEALKQDLRKHPVEAYRDEIGVVKKSAEHSLRHIKQWMAPKKQIMKFSAKFRNFNTYVISEKFPKFRNFRAFWNWNEFLDSENFGIGIGIDFVLPKFFGNIPKRLISIRSFRLSALFVSISIYVVYVIIRSLRVTAACSFS
ncbi:hypothetical protein MIMGU_mgv1a0038972mg, partial [Erythranthe guttata]